MKLKSLLYGTAAVLMGAGASSGALAADPPMAAEPVDYVRICDAFGSGFFYMPGTDTCLKLNGRVRVRAFITDDNDSDDDTDHYKTYARGYMNMDARTQTDLGLLRSYVSIYATYGSGGISTSNYALKYGAGFTLDEAFITLSSDAGQWTFGKTGSFFDFFGGYTYTGNGGFDQTTDANMFAYTFNIGNGISATLSLEDPYALGRKNAKAFGSNATGGGGAGFEGTYHDPSGSTHFAFGTIYGGQDIPDIVANLRADQGWGSFQIMGVARHIRQKEGTSFSFTAIGDPTFSTSGTGAGIIGATGTLTTVTGVSHGDKWGWAIGAGLEVDIPGTPVAFATQFGYSKGAGSYVAAAPSTLVDAIYNGDTGSLVLTEVWQIGAGVSIAATPTVSFNIDGAYGDIDHAGTLYDYDYWGIAAQVGWKPVSGLAVGAEIQYSEVNPDKAPALSNISDTNSWQLTINFQRDF